MSLTGDPYLLHRVDTSQLAHDDGVSIGHCVNRRPEHEDVETIDQVGLDVMFLTAVFYAACALILFIGAFVGYLTYPWVRGLFL